MKKRFLLFAISLILTLPVHAASASTSAMTVDHGLASEDYTITEPYVYDVVPGTDQWNELTPQERHTACYVSAGIAENMTTEALIETVLEYPYWINVYAFDSLDLGIEMISSYFPPLPELLGRSDAITELREYSANRSVFTRSGDLDLKAYGAEALQAALGDRA